MRTEKDNAKLTREGAASLGLGNTTRCQQPPPGLLLTCPFTPISGCWHFLEAMAPYTRSFPSTQNTREITKQPTWQPFPGSPRFQQGKDTGHRWCPQAVRLRRCVQSASPRLHTGSSVPASWESCSVPPNLPCPAFLIVLVHRNVFLLLC